MIVANGVRLLCLHSLSWIVAAWHERVADVSPLPPAGGIISTDPDRGVLIDEDGRERIFHGTNVVYKGSPYSPPMFPIDTETSFGEDDMDLIASWGMNNVRLGVLWAGAEPKKGEFNYTYLNTLRKIVDALGSRGIYTYVELHQDAFGERFCGDGFPSWVINETVASSFPQPLLGYTSYPLEKDGLPSQANCKRQNWAKYYGSKAIGDAFQRFYDNTDGLADRFALVWQKVAAVFKNSTWLLGYELMNEPWAGDHWTHPNLVWPGVADLINLAPFYTKVAAKIQEVDTDHLVMFEPIPWNNFAKTGFLESPCGTALANKSVYAYHYYRPPDMMTPARYMSYRTADAARLKSAGFLTEFATSWNVPDGTAPEHDTKHALAVIAAAENYTQSWSGWQYKVFHPASGRHPMTPGDMSMFHPNGSLDSGIVRAVSQPYARAVAGDIKYNKFTHARPRRSWPFGRRTPASYVLEYTARTSCKLPTEVYVNEKMHFPGGITVSALHVIADYNATARILRVTHGPRIMDGDLVTIKIEERKRHWLNAVLI